MEWNLSKRGTWGIADSPLREVGLSLFAPMPCALSLHKVDDVSLPFDVGSAIGRALANGVLVDMIHAEVWEVLGQRTCPRAFGVT